MQFLWRLYQRRIINVNINIAVAGFLAMAPTVGIIHLMTTLTHMPEPEDMSQGQKLFINGMTFIVDIFFDVVIYYGLHWLANQYPLFAGGRSRELRPGSCRVARVCPKP